MSIRLFAARRTSCTPATLIPIQVLILLFGLHPKQICVLLGVGWSRTEPGVGLTGASFDQGGVLVPKVVASIAECRWRSGHVGNGVPTTTTRDGMPRVGRTGE